MVRCRLCREKYAVITNTHLLQHGTTLAQYRKKFGSKGTGFAESISSIPKDDPRYLAWRESLKKRPPPWSKGHTKLTHPGIAKMAKTFRRKGIDNFSVWRRQHPVIYPKLIRNEDLAFLTGMVLGDGNLHKFPRTESLRITLGTDKPKLWAHTAKLVEKVFKKRPNVRKVKNSNCVTISLYRKHLSDELSIPLGARRHASLKVPNWIADKRANLISFLRGLYEAEGSFCIHKPTYTYKFLFSNRNDTLLRIVYNALAQLGFHPHMGKYQVQVSRKKEVYAVNELLSFRRYN